MDIQVQEQFLHNQRLVFSIIGFVKNELSFTSEQDVNPTNNRTERRMKKCFMTSSEEC